jgi:hypothetical protein
LRHAPTQLMIDNGIVFVSPKLISPKHEGVIHIQEYGTELLDHDMLPKYDR